MNVTGGRILVALLGALLAGLPAGGAAAQSTGATRAVVPGSVDNEVHIHIANASRAPLVGLTAVAAEVPPAVRNLRIEPARIDRIEHDRSAEFTILFDVAAGTPEGRLTPLEIEVVVEEGDLDEDRAALVFTVTPAPDLTVCAIRDDAPEDFPVENTFDYCDFERQPTELDRVGVFFTPPRDVSEPLDDVEPFHWRIVGPNDDVQNVRSGTFGTVHVFAPREEVSTPFAREGSPGRFAAVIDLWDRRDDPDPAAARHGPGTYTVQTVRARYDPSGVLGQGSSPTGRAIVGTDDNGDPIFAEWEPVAEFEVGSVRLHFQGFVAEQVGDQFVPATERMWEGKISVDQPQVSGTTVTFAAMAWVRDAVINGFGRFPAEEIQRAGSYVTLEFPEQLDPGHEKLGEIAIEVEPTETSDYLFTAGMHLLIPTTQAPPDRYLVQGPGFPAAWSEDGDRYEADGGCPGASGGYGVDYADQSGDSMGLWVFPRVFNPTYCSLHEVAEMRARVILLSGEPGDIVGLPARSLLAHLQDESTLWVIPVFLDLTDSAAPRERRFALKTYGYAIYAARPGTYAGPPPADRPEEGVPAPETGEDPSTGGDPSGADDRSTGDDTGGGDPSTAGGGGAPGDPTGGGNPAGGGVPTGGDPGPDEAAGGGGPTTIDPADADIAALIREWLGVAEPVENADGADFRYDPWGRLVGSAAPGMGQTRPGEMPPPDGGAGRPEAYAWEQRAALDSIDHCTLEEYVTARLAEEPIDRCLGRYTRTVAAPALTGLPFADAMERLRGQGLAAEPRLLGPAPTPEAANRVAGQNPAGGERLARGATVQLDLYGDYVAPGRVLPDVVGMPFADASAALQALGLTIEPSLRGPAPSPAQAAQVASQEPAAGASVPSGSTVRLELWGDYVAPQPDIPDPVDRGTGGRADRGGGDGPEVPNLQCPATLTFSHRNCLPDHVLSMAPPLGSPASLVPAESGYNRLPDGRNVLNCTYAIGNTGITKVGVTVSWHDSASTGMFASMYQYCRQDRWQSGWWDLYSPTRKVDGMADGMCFDVDQTTRLARDLMRQVEPYALGCNENAGGGGGAAGGGGGGGAAGGGGGGGAAGGGGGGAGGGGGGGGGNAAGNIAGSYTTSFGSMTLSARAGGLSGEYVRGGRVYIESLENGGRVAHGIWVQPDSARRCASERYGSVYWGRFTFRFNDRFSAFDGEYSYCDEAVAGAWSGSRSGDSQDHDP